MRATLAREVFKMYHRRMCARRSGVIINIVGMAARTPNHRYIAGCMANIALNMFTQCLGGES
jgi:NAD(P)-dependent dehydrogenase (short-subunit alcohol dehydrogenase family)